MCASKIDTHLDGNAVRSKITDFRTALYPRQYHPSILEKPLNKRFFAYKVFFRRTGMGKTKKCGVTAANTNLRVYQQTGAHRKTRYTRSMFEILFIKLIGVAGCHNCESVVRNIRRKCYILIGNGGVHKVVVVRG